MNILDIVDKYVKIPQDYSFFVFGTHGTGLQSLLFFLAKLTKSNKSVVPLPLHWTNIEVVPYLTGILWKKKILGFLPKSAWGITFEGSPKNLKWIQKNIQKRVPAIILVRDPIDALISHINYYIGKDIFVNNQFSDIDLYCKDILCSDTQVDRTCGFKKNLVPLEANITDVFYIDTQDIIGKQTNITLKKIADFLDFDYPELYDFDIRVNSQFERPFPFILIENGCKYYLSCFPNKYKNEVFPNYKETKIHYIDECYQSSYFPDKRFYIFSEDKISNQHKNIYSWADSMLYQHCLKMQKYEAKKIGIDDFFDFLVRHDIIYCRMKKYFEEQIEFISRQNGEMISKWKNFHAFYSLSLSNTNI